MFALEPLPQRLFIFNTVEFILAGLVLIVLLWVIWREPSKRERLAWWVVALACFVASFGAGVWTSYRVVVDGQASASAPLFYLSRDLLETGALAALAWSILRDPWGYWAILGAVAVAIELEVILWWDRSFDALPSLTHSASALGVTLFGLVGLVARARRQFPRAGLGLLCFLLAHASMLVGNASDWAYSSWPLAALLSTLGLAGLALAVEDQSRDLFAQAFVRLNLVFIFLAGALMVLVSERNIGASDQAGVILVIFFACTSAVAVASLMIGMVVHGATEQLRQQVRQIEQSERQLMQAAKLASIGELVSGVAHEINNPLEVILSRTQYQSELVREGSGSDDLEEDLDAIGRQAQRINQIVQDLLSFSRPHPMTLRGVSLAEVVTRCLTLTGARLRATGVQTRVELPDSLQRVWADPDRLEQVLVNLVNNAIDAMSGAGELRIGARVQGDRVLLSVADTGEGIPEENLKRIFDPFFSTKPGKGTGLGLSISYGIVRDHGGSVWVESQPGEGSTFFISLPTEVES